MVFVDVGHRVADKDLFDHPSGREQEVGDKDIEIFIVVSREALTLEGAIEYEEHLTVLVPPVIRSEDADQRVERVVFHIEGLEHVELASDAHLPDHEPVDHCIGVEGNHQGSIGIAVGIEATVILQCAHDLE